jgi:hypothetical protein
MAIPGLTAAAPVRLGLTLWEILSRGSGLDKADMPVINWGQNKEGCGKSQAIVTIVDNIITRINVFAYYFRACWLCLISMFSGHHPSGLIVVEFSDNCG